MDREARALLFPLSQAAIHSLQLPENRGSVRKFVDDQTISWPPSPLSEAGISELIESRKGIEPVELCVELKQSNHLHRFTLRSAEHNFLVLKADPSSIEDVCYINIEQCRMYPDPDSALIWLENPSTALQCAEKIDLERDGRIVTRAALLPKEMCILQPGPWNCGAWNGAELLALCQDQSRLRPAEFNTMTG